MSRFGGAVVVAVCLGVAMAPVAAAGADERPAAGADRADQARDKKCATRHEYRQIDVKGKKTSTLRQVRKIIGSNGRRDRVSHAEGHKWEIRKYRSCGSRKIHVYVNYMDNKAYYKTR